MRTIALEEHFVTADLARYGASTRHRPAGHLGAGYRQLLDITGERLAMMDTAGLDVAVLSLNSPGIQADPTQGRGRRRRRGQRLPGRGDRGPPRPLLRLRRAPAARR